MIQAYTDGSARNGGTYPMGYAWVIDIGTWRWELACYVPPHITNTNNRAEALAAIGVFQSLNPEAAVNEGLLITTDSEWVMYQAQEVWQANVNLDLVHALRSYNVQYQAQWNHVRGHTGHPENERCDALAKWAVEAGDSSGAPLQPQLMWCRLLNDCGRVMICKYEDIHDFEFDKDTEEGREVWRASATLFSATSSST